MPKPILDYTGRVFVRGINSHIWLTDREMRLLDLLARGLDFDAVGDWTGTLHILVELVEEGDDGRPTCSRPRRCHWRSLGLR
jgi:hypothetical protein